MGKQTASPLAIVIAIVVLLVVLFVIYKLTVAPPPPPPEDVGPGIPMEMDRPPEPPSEGAVPPNGDPAAAP